MPKILFEFSFYKKKKSVDDPLVLFVLHDVFGPSLPDPMTVK